MKKYGFLFYPLLLVPVLIIGLICSSFIQEQNSFSIALIMSICNLCILLIYVLSTRPRLKPEGSICWPKLLFMFGISLGLIIIFYLCCWSKTMDRPYWVELVQEIILLGGLTALTEELIFREYMITKMQRLGWSAWTCIVVSCLIFTFIHASHSGIYTLSLIACGIYTGWLYYRYRALESCIIVHWSYNGLYYILNRLVSTPEAVITNEIALGLGFLFALGMIIVMTTYLANPQRKYRLWFLRN